MENQEKEPIYKRFVINPLIWILVLIIGSIIFAKIPDDKSSKKPYEYNPYTPIFYNSSGQISGIRPKIWDDFVTPTTAVGNSINYKYIRNSHNRFSSSHWIKYNEITCSRSW